MSRISIAQGQTFCAISEAQLARVSELCRWPQEPVHICQKLTILDQMTCARVMGNICHLWSGVCGLELVPTTNPGQANVLATSSMIDGPNGILGQSYLPCGNVSQGTQLSQILDSSEGWTEDLLTRVWLHELGHAIGLSHAPIGTGAVMEPILTSLAAPQPWDIQQVVARYGPPSAPVPTPPPTEGGDVFGGGVLINIQEAGTYLFAITMVKR